MVSKEELKKLTVHCGICGSVIGSMVEEYYPDPFREELTAIEAFRAEAALAVYHKLGSDSQQITSEGVSNLMTGLMHLCDRENINMIKVIQNTLDSFVLDRGIHERTISKP